MAELLEQAGAEKVREHSRSALSGKPHCARNGKVSRSVVQVIVEKMSKKALYDVNDRIIDVAEQTVLDASETCDVDQNKTAVQGALHSVLISLLLSIKEKFSRIRESIGEANVQVATASNTLNAAASAMARDAAVVAPIVNLAMVTVKKEAKSR